MRYSPPPKDLSGQKFGKLTALYHVKIVNDRHISGWVCICECGSECTVQTRNLTSGNTKSCGCSNTRRLDLTGQKFGRLLIFEKGHKGKRGEVYWKVRCDCGKEKEVRANMLVSGEIVSCGCYGLEQRIKSRKTHGLSNTREYAIYTAEVRRERKLLYDSEWTPEMHQFILDVFTSCIICGSIKKLSVDHVIPLSKGGGLKPGNAVVLCQSHNSKKFNKDLCKLDEDQQNKILSAAALFKTLWEKHLEQ